MPPDRTRLGNAQGRQKSCSECAKGKRKCDLSFPSCTRCQKQHLACTYPQQPPRSRDMATEDSLEHGSYVFGTSDVFMGLEDLDQAELLPLDFAVPGLQASNTDRDTFDLEAGITSLESLSNMFNSPTGETQLAIERAYPLVKKSFSLSNIAPFARTRMEWSIAQLKLIPKMAVEQNGTPWQHCKLYDESMPRSLQDAHAACALYLAKNGTNDEFVTRFISERAMELITSSLPLQTNELLARAHALMLYQSILVFGGDIRLYSQAETLLPHMETVGEALLSLMTQQVDDTGLLPLYPSTAARASWTAYISRESLRRTVLSLFHFVAMCYFLRGQLASCNEHLAVGSRLTFSAQLWDAKTAFDYAVAWNAKKYLIVRDLDFSEVLKSAVPEDVDTFTKMMLIGIKGEDDIRGWFYTRGGAL
jgi:hypothetical protein